jgi:hypothetical protein
MTILRRLVPHDKPQAAQKVPERLVQAMRWLELTGDGYGCEPKYSSLIRDCKINRWPSGHGPACDQPTVSAELASSPQYPRAKPGDHHKDY